MSSTKQHPFHLVNLSPWPLLTAGALFFLTLGATMMMHEHQGGSYMMSFGAVSVLGCAVCWWRDVINEGVDNHHTDKVRAGLKLGMTLFIVSEVMFFFAFFFSFFFASNFPAGILEGVWVKEHGVWPPKNIRTFDPWDIPFINTLILLLSGTTVTWAHHAVEHNQQKDSVTALGLTVLLGISFSLLQAYEYHHAAFGLHDGVYAANFYLATGFHGLHVMIGTIFLAVCCYRAYRGDFIDGRGYLGFEFAAWYWHFVDVVWLFLFVFIYIFGR